MSFVCGSAIGFYGTDRQDELLDEDAGRGEGFLAELCRDWEEATGPAFEAGARVVNVRTGIVQTPRAGALAKQLPLFRMGVGGPLGSGSQWISWISIDDIASVFAHAARHPFDQWSTQRRSDRTGHCTRLCTDTWAGPASPGCDPGSCIRARATTGPRGGGARWPRLASGSTRTALSSPDTSFVSRTSKVH